MRKKTNTEADRLARTEGHVIRILRTVQQLEQQLTRAEQNGGGTESLVKGFYAMGAEADRQFATRPTLAFTAFLERTLIPDPKPGEDPEVTVSPCAFRFADDGIELEGSYTPIRIALSQNLQYFLADWVQMSLDNPPLHLVRTGPAIERFSQSEGDPHVHAHVPYLRPLPSPPELGA